MLKDLLVHVDSSESGRHRTQFALELAVRVGARLSGLHVTPPADVPPLYKAGQVSQVAQQLTAQLIREAGLAETIFRAETSELPEATWFAAQGDVIDGICQQARFSDMVILGQYERQGAYEHHPFPIAHAASVRCGRPVLVVPAGVQKVSLHRIAVAWDGSREATRALHDALPLLRLAQAVDIVSVATPDACRDSFEIDRLQQHLNRHGVESAAVGVQRNHAGEHDSLRKHLERGPYDLVVMGSYSHPVWIEFVFGGATESILMSSMMPILVSH